MLHAPNLERIYERLQRIDFEEWGPDGIRYVCILFWDDLGYRHLENSFGVREWEKWSFTSGDFWDLFLAGCYQYAPVDMYGQPAEILAHEGSKYFYWNRTQSELLAKEVAARAAEAGTVRPWTFTGPIELVAIAARRTSRDGIDMDWASLRGSVIRSRDLPDAVGSYTEAHISLDPEDVPNNLPSPGSFTDDVTPEVKRELKRAVPLLAKLFAKAHGLPT